MRPGRPRGARVRLSAAGPWSNVSRVRIPTVGCLFLWLCVPPWAILGAASVQAVEALELHIEVLEGEGFGLADVRAMLRPGEDHHGLELHIGTVRVGDGLVLEAVRLECEVLHLEGLAGSCPRGRVRFVHALTGPQSLTARFTYAHPGSLDLELEGLALAGGPTSARVRLDAGRWRLEAHGRALDLQALAALSAEAGFPWPVTPAGAGEFTLTARGRDALPDALDLELTVADTNFASADGLQAGEAIGAGLSVVLVREGADYRIDLAGSWRQGGAYLHPVFVEAVAPLTLSVGGRFAPSTRSLTVETLRFDHPGVVSLAARGAWITERGLAGLDATVDLDGAELPAAYETYLQPFLPGTSLDALDTVGLVAGRLRLQGGTPREVALNAVRVGMRDRLGRFAVDGLDAGLHWRAEGMAPPSRVAIDGGHLYRIALGPTRFQPVIGRDGFHLPSAVHLPVLDGALEIRDLQLAGLGTTETRWRFDGALTPVSMERLTAALDWPELSGTLSGIIPDVRYEQGLLTVGGRLLVRAFDGSVTVGDLRMRDPLGVAPELSAQIELRGLDLAELTRTFDFGEITGRLDGDVRDLVLVRWSPVRFDALFRTPPGDTSPRRISQRAVDNLTRLGGGVGGVVSGGFLRFFEDFSYRQLGLSCRLEGAVCHMDGVAPASQGYYIVQGAGLPRIDVIGFTREVAWRDLVARLAVVVQEGAGPAVR
jgi:hypothetical protein